MLLFIMYGWAVIPSMYIFSFVFEVASTAFVRMTILNVITGLATLLVVYILSIPSIGLLNVAKALKWAFLVLPNYNLGQGMVDLFNNYQFMHAFENEDPVSMCKQFVRNIPGAGSHPKLITLICKNSLKTYHRGSIDVNQCIKDDMSISLNATVAGMLCNGIEDFLNNATSHFQYNYLAWDNPGIGRFLIFLAIEGFIFFSIVLMIEYRVLRGLFRRLQATGRHLLTCVFSGGCCCETGPVVYVVSNQAKQDHYDSDVADEKRKIDNQFVNNNVLTMKDLYKIFHPRAGKFFYSYISFFSK